MRYSAMAMLVLVMGLAPAARYPTPLVICAA